MTFIKTFTPHSKTDSTKKTSTAPLHGGRLKAAARQFHIPESQWLDLSTGISPFIWPVPKIPETVWQRLPDNTEALDQSALNYYGGPVISVPGSQWAIQHLPSLFGKTRVWIPYHCYEEHPYWWQFHHHTIQRYHTLPNPEQLQKHDVVIVINPNNPTAHFIDKKSLQSLASDLSEIQGYLIVDEAFMDYDPQHSLIQNTVINNIIVLRSIGKFFGLAGLRLGFVHASTDILNTLKTHLGPWSINHPALYLGEQALNNTDWQNTNRLHINTASNALSDVLQSCFPDHLIQSCGLFSSLSIPKAEAFTLFQHCAQQGILLRRFEHWDLIRFGLMKTDQLKRLEQCLVTYTS